MPKKKTPLKYFTLLRYEDNMVGFMSIEAKPKILGLCITDNFDDAKIAFEKAALRPYRASSGNAPSKVYPNLNKAVEAVAKQLAKSGYQFKDPKVLVLQ